MVIIILFSSSRSVCVLSDKPSPNVSDCRIGPWMKLYVIVVPINYDYAWKVTSSISMNYLVFKTLSASVAESIPTLFSLIYSFPKHYTWHLCLSVQLPGATDSLFSNGTGKFGCVMSRRNNSVQQFCSSVVQNRKATQYSFTSSI
jgi:hypothetical protein